MWSAVLHFVLFWTLCQSSHSDEQTDRDTRKNSPIEEVDASSKGHRKCRATPRGIAEYRSALTLDYLAAEDKRQHDVNQWYKSFPPVKPYGVATANCVDYPRPTAGKVARLLLDLFKNLEGDNGTLTIDLVQSLIHANLLMESKYFEEEPDLEALLKVPESLRGEPHATFPKILTMLWFAVTDPGIISKQGWCPLKTTSRFLSRNRPKDIAKQMRILDPVLARVRFIVEEFIHHVSPIIATTKRVEKTVLRGGWERPIDGGDDDGVNMVMVGAPIRLVERPPISVPVAKMPFLDADGRVHETVNVVKEQAPYGPLPNVRLADAGCQAGVASVLLFITLLVFLLE